MVSLRVQPSLPMRWLARVSGRVRVQSTHYVVLGTPLVMSEGGRGCCCEFFEFLIGVAVQPVGLCSMWRCRVLRLGCQDSAQVRLGDA